MYDMDYHREIEKMQTVKYNPAVAISDFICLYGAGSLGQMAMDCMNLAGIRVSRIFDRTRTGNINGVLIESLDNISKEECGNILLLVTICTLPYEPIAEDLQKWQFKQIMPFYTYAYLMFPRILSNGWYLANMTRYTADIYRICGLLEHDERSLHHYLSFLWWKCAGKEVVYQNYPILSKKKYFASPNMIKLGTQESFLDCGCHCGDTIKQFLDATCGEYKSIYALEPDIYNLELAKERFPNENIIWDSKGVSDRSGSLSFRDGMGFASKLDEQGEREIEVVTIDDLGIEPSIIKIHVEGAEYSVLKGAYRTIARCRPLIMVFADHSIDGLSEIPNVVTQYNDYLLYFNYCDYCGNSAIFYMIPKEKMDKE